MDEIRFKSLNDLFNRLYPAFNTKVNELKRKNIIVSEIELWNYFKNKLWINNDNLTLYDMVNDILSLDETDLIRRRND